METLVEMLTYGYKGDKRNLNESALLRISPLNVKVTIRID